MIDEKLNLRKMRHPNKAGLFEKRNQLVVFKRKTSENDRMVT
jgi:hypothetical protein